MPSQKFGEFAMQTANQGVGAILGLLTGQYNDDRQYNQQERLQRLQIQGSKELTDYQFSKQLQMWKDTNYWAQVAELEKAGLNPALMYGMSGGGGTTTGGGAVTTTGAQAPAGGHEIQRGLEMGIQMAMMKAQTRVMETQADKNEAEANKTKGVDTAEAESRIKQIAQGIENAKAQKRILDIEDDLKDLELQYEQGTLEDRMETIMWTSENAANTTEMLFRQNLINKITQDDIVKTIREKAIQVTLENALLRAQKNLTNEQITEIKEKVKLYQRQVVNLVQENMRGWDKMTQENRKIAIDEALADMQQEYALPDRLINVISETIFGIFSGKLGQSTITPNRVGYK